MQTANQGVRRMFRGDAIGHPLRTTDVKQRCTVHTKGTWFAPVTNNSDTQDSQKLGSVCFKRGLVPGTYPYRAPYAGGNNRITKGAVLPFGDVAPARAR
eukprot:5768117-Pyramimonas_sp.AAC.1